MSDPYRKAYVYVDEVYAGCLKETEEGYSFMYDETYLKDETSPHVSLTLPKRTEEYVSNVLFSFFDGLIPEGWLLNMVIKNWKLNQNDRFGLLLVACKDPIGNVTISEVRR